LKAGEQFHKIMDQLKPGGWIYN